MYFDPLYLLFSIPGLLLSMFASFYVKSTFSKYSKVRTYAGLTGAQAAQQMLSAAGITYSSSTLFFASAISSGDIS